MPLLPPTPTYAAAASLESPLTPWTPAITPAGNGTSGGQQPGQQQGQPGGQAGAAAEQQQQAGVGGQPAGQQLAGAGAAGQQAGPTAEQRELELQLYADFLRIVLEASASDATSSMFCVVGSRRACCAAPAAPAAAAARPRPQWLAGKAHKAPARCFSFAISPVQIINAIRASD